MQTVSSPKDFHRKYCIWCAPLHAHCTLNRIHNIVRDIKCTLCCRTMYILYRIWNMYIVQNKCNKVSAYRERQTVYELLNRFAFNRILLGAGGGYMKKRCYFSQKYVLYFSFLQSEYHLLIYLSSLYKRWDKFAHFYKDCWMFDKLFNKKSSIPAKH